MGIPDPLDQHPPLPFPRLAILRAGRRKEGAAHADGAHLEDAVAQGRQRADQSNEESMGPELSERDVLGTGPTLEEGGNLRKGRRGRIDLEELKEATGRVLGLTTNVKADTGPPPAAEILHPVWNGAASDPEFYESGGSPNGPSGCSTGGSARPSGGSRALLLALTTRTRGR